jgi:hypothetical protein
MKKSKAGCPSMNPFGGGFVVEREYDHTDRLVALFIQAAPGKGPIRSQPVDAAGSPSP